MAILKVFKSFAGRTSLTGFNRLTSKKRLNTLVWALIILVVSLGSVYHLSQLSSSYYEYKVNSAYVLKPDLFEFPDVTLCATAQTSNVRYNEIRDNKRDVFGMQNITRRFWKGFWYYEVRKNATNNMRGYDNLVKNNISDILQIDETSFNMRDSPEHSSLDHIVNMHERFTYQHYLSQMARKIEDILISCKYGTEICSITDFVQYDDPYHFNCFTFRPKNRSVVDSESASGATKTLKLVLHREDGQRIASTASDFMSHTIGFYVIIHAAKTLPNSGHKILAETGYKTSIFVNIDAQKRLNLPGKRCKEDGERITLSSPRLDYEKVYEVERHQTYDPQEWVMERKKRAASAWEWKVEKIHKLKEYDYHSLACKIRAYQFKMYKMCKCVNPLLHVPLELLAMKNQTTCGDIPIANIQEIRYDKISHDVFENSSVNIIIVWKKTNEKAVSLSDFIYNTTKLDTQMRCFHDNTHRDKTVERSCPDACETKYYFPLTINRAKFPYSANRARNVILHMLQVAMKNSLDNRVLTQLNESLSMNRMNTSFFRSVFQQVEITPISSDMSVLEESRATTPMELLSSIGGMFGLWSGVCVITFFEILELCMFLIMELPVFSRMKQI